MVLQDKTSVSVDGSVHSVAGEGHVPKIRKPYTITKQRERWTEEEHKKFLEALKLYGRAWRKIEEHVGTKTAVQIRSHAQKFFSKVVRETSNTNSNTVEPIEIPPPRPKRKPMHPYPRKLVLGAGKESPVEQRVRSTSPHSSLSEQDNGSPTSVLSNVISDAPGSGDATTPNGSPPPISSADMGNQSGLFLCGDNLPQDDGHLSESVPIDPVSVKLELFPNICTYDKEDCTAGKVLKLFGKDVVVPNKPLNSSTRISMSPFSDMGEGMFETSENTKPVDTEMRNLDSSHNQFDGGDDSMDGNAIQVEKPIPLPWWILFRGAPIPPLGCQSGDALDKETHVEESCAGSNSGSVDGEANADKNWDAETQSDQCAPQSVKDEKSSEKPNPSSLERKSGSYKIMKGFVPYKRCFSDRDLQSSTITNDERESQRIRLCL